MKSTDSRARWKEIERGLGSVGRLRMLRSMVENPNRYFTKYALERETGLKPTDVRSNLEILTELGWVKEYDYDPKTYKINMENEIVKLIADLFQKIK